MNKRIEAPEGVLVTKREEEKNNITLQSIDLERSHKYVPESSNPPSSKTRISVLSWTVSTFKTPDSNTTIDLLFKVYLIAIFFQK
jgi:hypothetical protein